MEDLPILSSNPNDSRSVIVKILSRKWPLTAKQVYYEARKHNHDLTYQAIHKTIKQLGAQRVVDKVEGGYRLNKLWVNGLFSFTNNLKKKELHGSAKSFLEMPPNSTLTFEFNTRIVEPYYWLLEEILSVVNARKKKGQLILHTDGAWPITVLTDKEYDQFVSILKYLKMYELSRTNTFLDRLLLNFSERSFRIKWKAPVPCAEKCEIISFYDFVIQKHESTELKAAWKKAYSIGRRPLTGLSTIYSLIFGEKKYGVKFVVMRNENYAKTLTNTTLALFR